MASLRGGQAQVGRSVSVADGRSRERGWSGRDLRTGGATTVSWLGVRTTAAGVVHPGVDKAAFGRARHKPPCGAPRAVVVEMALEASEASAERRPELRRGSPVGRFDRRQPAVPAVE